MKLPYLSHFRRADLNCLLFRFRSSFPVPIFLFAALRSPLSAFRSPFPISLSSFSIPRYLSTVLRSLSPVSCSPFLVLRSLFLGSSVPRFLGSSVPRFLFPVLYWPFTVPRSLFPIFLSLFSFPYFPFPVFRFLFSVSYFPFSVLPSLVSVRCSLFFSSPFPVPCSLFTVPYFLFPFSLLPVLCSPFSIFSSPFSVPCSLFSVSCSRFSVLCSPSLRSPAGSLFTIPRAPILIPSFFLFPKVKGNKERQTGRQTSPSSVGVGLHCWTFICCFIKTALPTFASFRPRKCGQFRIYYLTFIYFQHVSWFLIHIYSFPIFSFPRCLVLIIFKLCIYAVSTHFFH